MGHSIVQGRSRARHTEIPWDEMRPATAAFAARACHFAVSSFVFSHFAVSALFFVLVRRDPRGTSSRRKVEQTRSQA